MTRTFKFTGVGEGIPGLAHEVTDDQAKALGLGEVLRSAVANGSYSEVKPERKPEPRTTATEGE